MKKIKQCGVCLKDFPTLWKAKRKLPDGTISPAMCKDCALEDATPIGEFKMTSNKTLQKPKTFKPINKQSDKEKKRQASYLALRKVYMEQHPMCMFKDCQRASEECHHVVGRLGERLLDTNEWMAVCSEHHRYIHDNDKECRELGYLKSRLI